MNGQNGVMLLARAGGLSRVALALTLGALLAAFPASAQEEKQTQEPALVGVDEVRAEPLNRRVPALGRLVARQAGAVSARIGGPVESILVQVGDRVKVNQVMAVLVKDTFIWNKKLKEGNAARAAAAVNTARAEAGLLNQEVRRLEELRGSAAFSKARLEDKRQELVRAQSAVAEDEAALAAAQAQLRLSEIDLSVSDVRAPYAGVVSQLHTESGSYVRTGDPVVTLINDQHMEIEADVPTEWIFGLTPGVEVSFELGDGRTFKAKVRATVPEENPLTRTRRVRFTPLFDDLPPGLASRQAVSLSIPAGAQQEAITVHKDAILNREGDTLVYLVSNGKADIRSVTLGEAVGGRFAVLKGLNPGDVVVIRGNERLSPGQPVTWTPLAGTTSK